MQTDAWRDAYLAVWPGPTTEVAVDGAWATLVRRGPSYELLGRELYEPTDVVWADREAAARLAFELRRRPLSLNRILGDSPLVEHVPGAFVRPGRPCPIVHLDGRWRTEVGGLSARRASDLRRARRRAEEHGAVQLEIVAPTEADADTCLARLAAVEDAGWKGHAGTSLARDVRRRRFFSELARRTAAAGELRFAFLTIDGEDAAGQLALVWRDAWWVLKIGYDPRFARASPGQLLMFDTIRHAASVHLERYELLGTAAEWTAMWTRDVRPTASLVWIRPTPAGIATAAVEAIRALRRP